MHLTVMAAIYTAGYIICYLWLRTIVRNRCQADWILLDKVAVVAISFLSWGAIIGTLLIILSGSLFNIDFDKKCKW